MMGLPWASEASCAAPAGPPRFPAQNDCDGAPLSWRTSQGPQHTRWSSCQTLQARWCCSTCCLMACEKGAACTSWQQHRAAMHSSSLAPVRDITLHHFMQQCACPMLLKACVHCNIAGMRSTRSTLRMCRSSSCAPLGPSTRFSLGPGYTVACLYVCSTHT